MKASVLTDFGKIEYLDVPEPEFGYDEALVKVAYSGVCGTDVHVSQGHHPAAAPPLIMGHEFSGTVEKVGKQNKKGLEPGQRVVVQPFYSCGVCELCITGRDNVCPELRIFGVHRDGSFAEYVSAPVLRIHPVGKDADLKLAALTEPLAVALHDVRMSGMKVGQTVFVIGGGPIGVLIAAVARLNGASEILVTEINPFRKDLLTKLGFDVFDPSNGDVRENVRKRTAGRGYDRVFEVSGTKSGSELMLEAVKIGGTVMVVGIPTDKYPLDTDLIFKREIRIQGVRIHSQINFRDAVTTAARPEMQEVLRALVTHEFPLSDLDKAVDLAQNSKKVSKIIIKSV
jgi:2-desacetyl-2-hydroxyethyl bacteriochlorophyllide A dehydrogenase